MNRTHVNITLGLCVVGGPLCILLVQRHSVLFWQQYAQGYWTGLGWSAALELVSLLFWFQPWRGRMRPSWRYVGAVTTVVLLLGPIYELGAPLLADQVNQGSVAAEIRAVEAEHARYVAWTAEGRNFGPGLARTSEQLRALRAKQRGESEGKQATVTAARPTGLALLVALMQMASVVIFYLAIVLFITTVSDHFQGKVTAKVTPPGNGAGNAETPPVTGAQEPPQTPLADAQNGTLDTPDTDPPEDDLPEPSGPPQSTQERTRNAVDALVQILQRIVRQRLLETDPATGLRKTQNALARELGINAKNLVFLMHHFPRKAAKKQVLGINALQALSALLDAEPEAEIANAQNGLES